MKALKYIKSILSGGCVIFTFITLIAYSIGALLSDSEKSFIPSIKFIWLFFVFSTVTSAANMLLRARKIKLPLRLVLHFFVCLSLYFVTVVLCGGFIASGAQTLLAMSAFVLIYLICAVFIAIKSSRREKRKAEKEEYNSQFR